jgi:uncharacterized membrane protein YbhN (UPF0104 family)
VTPRSRRALSLALRFAVAGTGLVLAFRLALPAQEGEGASGVGAVLGAWQVPLFESILWFALAWVILGASLVVGAVRFRGLLRGAALDIGLTRLLRAYLVATFFNLVLPGAILGDVYRIFDARRDSGEGGRVLGIVVLERILSLAALGSIALLVAPVIPSVSDDRGLLWLLVAAGAGFVAIAFGVLMPRANRVFATTLRSLSFLPSGVANAGLRALDAVGTVAAKPRLLASAFGWSLVNQGLPVAALVVLAVPLDALVPWYWFAVIVPFVTLVSLLPISIGGTGVRELLFVSLFGAVGMRPEAALALSLSVLAAALAWGLVGLVLFAAGRRDEGLATTTTAGV